MTRYAIILSSEKYRDYSDTDYCYSDAITLFETLTGYLDFEENNIWLETLYIDNPDFGSDNILLKIRQTVDSMSENDSILFFYAGHGMVYKGEAYLVLPDTSKKDLLHTALSIGSIEEILLSKNVNSILFLDACHSGLENVSVRGKSFNDCIMETMSCVFSACTGNQCSYSLKDLEQGIFTYALCAQIKKCKPMTKVYVESLKIMVCDMVKEIADEHGYEQIPTLNMKSIGNKELATRNDNSIEDGEEFLYEENEHGLIEFKEVMEIVSPDKLMNSPHGIILPKKVNVSEIFPLIQNVKKTEIDKMQSYYISDDFETSAEKVWSRSILILQKRILGLGEEFVADMIGIDDYSFISNLPAYNCIILAYELGFIDDLGKMQLINSNNYINYFLSEDAIDEMPQDEANIVIKACIKYILGFKNDKFGLEFNDFRNRLRTSPIAEIVDVNMFETCPYFFLKTTIRALTNLIKDVEGIEFENVVNNMMVIVPKIWDKLQTDEKYYFGTVYVKHKSENHKEIAKALHAVLVQVKGYDYVPENVRSSAFISAAEQLISVHFGMNNFYNEPAAIEKLEKLGTKFPQPALNTCIKAVLFVKLGNCYGYSWGAQETANNLLDQLTRDDWKKYLTTGLPKHDDLLDYLIGKYRDPSMIVRWKEMVKQYRLSGIDVSDKKVRMVLDMK